VSATLVVRSPSPDEAPEVTRLINGASQAEYGVDDATEEEIVR
jgi:hypothetical protein